MSEDVKRYEGTDAYQIKERIKQRVREDKKARLEECWMLITTMHAKGESDFSSTKVGRLLEQKKIQKLQSYRNAQGKDYRDIVEAFTAEMGLRSALLSVPKITPLEQALKSIPDLDTQVRVRAMLEDLKRLRTENQLLRNEMSYMQRGRGGTRQVKEAAAINEVTATQVPGHAATTSLRSFLQADWMAAHDLATDASGAVLCAGETITLPGFVRQLAILIGD